MHYLITKNNMRLFYLQMKIITNIDSVVKSAVAVWSGWLGCKAGWLGCKAGWLGCKASWPATPCPAS